MSNRINTIGVNNMSQLINKPVFNAGRINNAPQKPANTFITTTIDTSSLVGPTGTIQLQSYMGNYIYIPAPLTPTNSGFTGTLNVILPTDAQPGYYLTIGTNTTNFTDYAMVISPPSGYAITYYNLYPDYITSTGSFASNVNLSNQYNLILSDSYQPGTSNRLYTISF